MKNVINYYYNMYPKSIRKINNYYYFELDQFKYYFVIYDRSLEELKYLYELNLNMINNNILVHKIILNKDKEAITLVNDIPYILMNVFTEENKKINLSEISYFNNSSYTVRFNKELMRTNWPSLWEKKIDYFEYQISQIGKKYPLIVDSFSYFVGLAENAIMYMKNTVLDIQDNSISYSVAHRRLTSDIKTYDFYNPLNFVIDYKTRDIAEYIKNSFLKKINIIDELDNYFYYNVLTEFEVRTLFARVLYPSIYFDLYEDVLMGKKSEKEILKLSTTTNEYEDYLLDIYLYLRKMYNIPEIEWLTKNKEIIPRL